MRKLRRQLFFFFFSIRRRHTRWPRDWSSDVCSSDLVVAGRDVGEDEVAVVVGAARADLDELDRISGQDQLEEEAGIGQRTGAAVAVVALLEDLDRANLQVGAAGGLMGDLVR